MTLKEHLLYGGIPTAGLYPFFGPKALYFLAGTVAVDFDHYADFLYYGRFKNWRIGDMFRFHNTLASWKADPDLCALEAFHTAEFMLGVLLVAWFFRSTEVWLLFSGMVFHHALDVLTLRSWGNVHIRALSFIEYVIRRRKKLRSGVRFEALYEKAYDLISKS